MAIDAHHLEPRQAGRVAVGPQGVFVCNAEFVALEAGGNVGVRLGIDVGVHTQTDWGDFAHAHRHFAEHIELGFTFDVEAADAHLQCLFHFVAGFAHP